MSSTFIDTQEWIPVHTLPGFEACIEYYINKEGQVKSSKGKVEKILKHIAHSSGYPSVKLTQRIGKGKTITVLVHKLVAFAFLDTPPLPYGQKLGHCCIDHIDENKYNCIDGLALKQCDKLSAFVEASLSISHGIKSKELVNGKKQILASLQTVDGVDFKAIATQIDEEFGTTGQTQVRIEF